MDTKIFGISEQALQLCEDRAVMLTNNLVNSSTPNYKARDIDFQKELQKAQGNAFTMRTTSAQHINPKAQDTDAAILYRVPNQKSLDGNTVDDEIERKNFIENALHYQVNLTFVRNTTTEMMKAIKGE
jgi:flagellar basal-body rod protein FlgB